MRHLLANEQLQQTNEEQMKRLQRANEELTIKQTQHDMEKKNLRDECETLKLTVNDTRKKVLDTKRDGQMICTHFELNIASSLKETKRIMEEATRKDTYIGRLEDTVELLKEKLKRSGMDLSTFLQSEVEYQNEALERTISTVDVSRKTRTEAVSSIHTTLAQNTGRDESSNVSRRIHDGLIDDMRRQALKSEICGLSECTRGNKDIHGLDGQSNESRSVAYTVDADKVFWYTPLDDER